MKSKIKKEQVLSYLMDKLNNNYFGVPFYMGIDGLPIYKPILDENGNITDFDFVSETTYKEDFTSKIPVSLIVSDGDYSVIKDLSGEDEDINSASFNATLGFLLMVEQTPEYKVMLESLEQVRDMLLGNLDILKANQYNYIGDTKELYSYLVATHCGDVQLGGELELNGKRYLEYILSIDLDISDNISYGNQYQWYISRQIKTWELTTKTYWDTYKKTKIELDQTAYTEPQISLFPNVEITEFNTALRVAYRPTPEETFYAYYKLTYIQDTAKRIMPLVVSWGSAQALSGFQMLRNNLLVEEDIKRAKMIHSVASTRGWAITLTLQLQDTKEVVVDLFRETLPSKDNLQVPYKLTAVYKKMTKVGETITFETYDRLGFELDLIPQDTGTSSVHGDNIVFTISLVPYWGGIHG